MQIEFVDSDEGLEALIPRWMSLWKRLPEATPFQSPFWLVPWWHQFGTAAPRILAARESDSLIGILPLYENHEEGGVKLLPLGISLSDYTDALVDLAHPDSADALLAATPDIPRWRECYLPDLPPGAALLRAPAPPGVVETRDPGSPCPVLVLPSNPDNLASVVPRKTLRDVRQAHARSGAIGPVTIEIAEPATIIATLDDLFRLHEKRWRRRSEIGVLADPAVRAFHREAAHAFCEAGLLRLYRLRIADAVAGVYYGFQCNSRAYAYLGGFDPEMTRLSPGAQLLHHAIDAAIAQGAREFHFLRGGESYKYAWGAVDRFNQSRRFQR